MPTSLSLPSPYPSLFFNDPATTEIYTLSLHDALPIYPMALRIGDEAPNFQAQTTEGPIDFHKWIGDEWAILFSHPKDFTPVCTTELGYMARIKPEFDKRNTRIIGLSADPVEDHKKWARDIEETQGAAIY